MGLPTTVPPSPGNSRRLTGCSPWDVRTPRPSRWAAGGFVRTGGRAELKRLYVIDGQRGRGHSRSIHAWLEKSAAAAGAPSIVLETNQRHAAAIGLHCSCGYTDVPVFGYYADDPLTVYLSADHCHVGPDHEKAGHSHSLIAVTSTADLLHFPQRHAALVVVVELGGHRRMWSATLTSEKPVVHRGSPWPVRG
ncbi:GNAT family N-acetyltransferase [Streptomyces sp. NPDC048518]|uniref:GNAT family N-acetyltransferase n=1 Tax=Streptomyces sp. NPDC048518 TaxID=3155029 RepID=UPI0033F36C5E